MTDDELHWYEPLSRWATCDGSQRLPITDLNQLRWEAGDLLELGIIEFHIAECSRPECRHRWPRRLRLRREHQRSYVLRQAYPDGMGPPWGYCTTTDALHGFLRGIYFGAQEITRRIASS